MRVVGLLLTFFTLSGLCIGRSVGVQGRLTRRNEPTAMAMMAMASDDMRQARGINSNAVHIAQISTNQVTKAKVDKPSSPAIGATATKTDDHHENIHRLHSPF
ncbi:hypothetical protein DFH28DRAFT_983282 [Melampsora americana]|nr:hypothetical protein DFH28DRAFT_983282 [Melampsora americana]